MDDELTVIKSRGDGSRLDNGGDRGIRTDEGQSDGWRGTIAVDMDDVLCQTNLTIVQMHNEMFDLDPPLTLQDFKHYLYWQNRGWGTPSETVEMVMKLYANGLYMKSQPIPGAKEGLLKLKQMGYRLIIITARSEHQRARTEDWLEIYMPDIFDELHFTGAFQHLDPTTEELSGHAAKKSIVSHHKRSKAEVVHQTKALMLIDDSAENALEASIAEPPVSVLLFGRYPWNEVVSKSPSDHGQSDKEEGGIDQMTYVEWVKKGLLPLVEERRRKRVEEGWVPPHVERVGDWEDVVQWLNKWEESGRKSV